MTTKTVLIDTGSTYTVPSDFGSLVSIEPLGAGGDGSSVNLGGGGGAYAIQTALAGIAAGNVYNINIGVHGGTVGTSAAPGTADTWFNSASATVYAQGGKSAGASPGTGGLATACFPTTGAFKGGDGNGAGNGAGGGAAGKNGAGGNASGATGGQGDNNTGGIGGVGGNNGSPGTEWSYQVHNTTVVSGTAGSGGGGEFNDYTGGPGGGEPGGSAGGLYGGGGGSIAVGLSPGAGGCIFFTYNVAVAGPKPFPVRRIVYRRF